MQQLGGGLRREPLGDEAASAARSTPPGAFPTSRTSASSDCEIVLARLDRDEERVERCDIDADGVVAGLERLDERRPRAGERVEHPTTGTHVALEQRLDELRHELAEIGMEPVDVLRPLAFGQLPLRPGEREVDLAVELRLRERHHSAFATPLRSPPRRAPVRGRRCPAAPREARARRRRCRAGVAAARRGRALAPRPVARAAAPAARAREPVSAAARGPAHRPSSGCRSRRRAPSDA